MRNKEKRPTVQPKYKNVEKRERTAYYLLLHDAATNEKEKDP